MPRILRFSALVGLFMTVWLVACSVDRPVAPAFQAVDARGLVLGDCPIDHWTADCFRMLTTAGGSNERGILMNAATGMTVYPSGHNCNTLGNYMLGHLDDARIIYGNIGGGGALATGDSHSTGWHPGSGAGRMHAADSVFFDGSMYPRSFTGSWGMLQSLVHEYAHQSGIMPSGTEDDFNYIAMLCLGYN